MKKILSLLLICVLMCTVLASCAEDEYGYKGEYDRYYKSENRKEITLDFYIIVGEGTTSNAIKTVSVNINHHLESKFKTKLDIHYVTADEYKSVVYDAAKAEGEARADIVLIAGKDMFDTLYEENLLVDMSAYYDSKNNSKYDSEEFAKLNTKFSTRLLIDASYVGDKIYTVPNDHRIGSYELVLVDRDVVEKEYNYSLAAIRTWTDYNSDEVNAVKAKIENGGEYDADEVIKYVSNASYDDIALYESQGYVCNVARLPEIDAEEAFKSAFAIVKDSSDNGIVEEGTTPEYYERYFRAMEVIYAINTDATLRNYLQYGIQGPNYTLSEGKVVRNDQGTGVYNMDLLYTGGLFNALYCDELGWTSDTSASVKAQNKTAVIPQ